MASSSPDPIPPPFIWLRWIIWGLLGAVLVWTVLGAVVPAHTSSATADAVARLVLLWAFGGVQLFVLQHLAGTERLGWLPLAVLLVMKASNQTLSGASTALGIDEGSPIQFWIACFAACLCVTALGRPGEDGASGWVQLAQGFLDIAVVLITALLALVMSSSLLPLRLPAAYVTFQAVLPELVVMSSVVLLSIVSPPTSPVVAVVLWGTALLCLTGFLVMLLGAALSGLGVIVQVLPVWELWRSGLLALAGVLSLGTGHQPQLASTTGLPRIASPLPGLTALLVLTLATVITPHPAWPALVVLLTLVAREVLVNARRQGLVRHFQAAFVAEQRTRHLEEVLAQERELTLARLFHDQAAPINGLWRVYRRLAEAKLPDISDAMMAQLTILQSLADDLRRKLTGQQAEAASGQLGRNVKLDVRPIIDEAVEAAKERLNKKDPPLEVSPYPKDTLVMGHAIALRRILDNLISNALDATPPTGQVVVEVWQDWQHPRWLSITVHDSGHGLTEEEQARAFDSQMPLKNGPGMGLGLSIVRDLAESMGACYGVESMPGQGSHFWLRLPRP